MAPTGKPFCTPRGGSGWPHVTSRDYTGGMAKVAGVRDLKAKLSEYLREVKHGETVLVTDRGRVVAQLVPPGEVAEPSSPDDRVRRQLMAEGLVTRMGTQERDDWPEPATLREGRRISDADFEAAFDAQRADR